MISIHRIRPKSMRKFIIFALEKPYNDVRIKTPRANPRFPFTEKKGLPA